MNNQAIAVELEQLARNALKLDDRSVRGTFVQADQIRSNSFVEVMLHLLRKKKGFTECMDDFYKVCGQYLGKKIDDIPGAILTDIFQLFKDYYSGTNTEIGGDI